MRPFSQTMCENIHEIKLHSIRLTEFSVTIEMICICTVSHSSPQPHVRFKLLKRGYCKWGNEFLILFNLSYFEFILFSLNFKCILNETVVFKTVDISPWRTVTLKRWKTKEMSLTITQAFCSERVSRLCYRGEKGRQTPAISLNCGEEAESLGRPRHTDFTYMRKDSIHESYQQKENIGLSHLTTDQWIYSRKLPKNR